MLIDSVWVDTYINIEVLTFVNSTLSTKEFLEIGSLHTLENIKCTCLKTQREMLSKERRLFETDVFGDGQAVY